MLLIGPRAVQQNVRRHAEAADRPLPQVPLDIDKFRQTILNLVINALEAMPGGGVSAWVPRSGMARDRGRGLGHRFGIPPEIKPDLFKPAPIRHQGPGDWHERYFAHEGHQPAWRTHRISTRPAGDHVLHLSSPGPAASADGQP